jgi:DNA-binding GntR family transcriptional regulator
MRAMPTRSHGRSGATLSGGSSENTDTLDRGAHVYISLRDLIVYGRLAPGTRLVETEIAERLDVSRTPVRSALQRLQQEGYVLIGSTGKQARLTVAPMTREDATEVFGILAEVEGLGARWAAALEPAARNRLAGELRELNESLAVAVAREPPNPAEVFDIHTRFHGHYMQEIDAPRLLALHAAIKPQAERYRRLYSALVHENTVSADEHNVIIRRIEEGDADAAQRAVQLNWRNAAERLARAIDLIGERGRW